MVLSLSSSCLLFQCMLLILQFFTPLSIRPNYATALSCKTNDSPMILALKTSKVSSLADSGQSRKLTFHDNVSLVISLSMGSPPQDVSMVLDTGSELSWLVCNSTYPNYFKSTSSSTYRAIPCNSSSCQTQAHDLVIPADCDQQTQMCHVSVSYADASTSSGILSSNSFHLGNSGPSTQLPLLFGCMDATFDSASTPTTGLLGMNRGSLSFCIPVFLPPLNYRPLVQISSPLPYFDRLAYSVQMEGIRFSNLVLPIPKSVFLLDHTGAGQTMLDSGTQFTFLSGEAYSVLKKEFLRQTKNILAELNELNFVFQGEFDTCFKILQGQLPPTRLPEVALILQGVEVMVTSELLLYRAVVHLMSFEATMLYGA